MSVSNSGVFFTSTENLRTVLVLILGSRVRFVCFLAVRDRSLLLLKVGPFSEKEAILIWAKKGPDRKIENGKKRLRME